MCTPTALHSGQSAMALLHTVLPACLITGQDRPGEWPQVGCEIGAIHKNESNFMGASNLNGWNVGSVETNDHRRVISFRSKPQTLRYMCVCA